MLNNELIVPFGGDPECVFLVVPAVPAYERRANLNNEKNMSVFAVVVHISMCRICFFMTAFLFGGWGVEDRAGQGHIPLQVVCETGTEWAPLMKHVNTMMLP